MEKSLNFNYLSELDLSEETSLELYEALRSAFEKSHPNNMVDASDAFVLTVFPFKWGDEIPDNYDVVNYATGKVGEYPALCKMDDSREILVLKDEHLESVN